MKVCLFLVAIVIAMTAVSPSPIDGQDKPSEELQLRDTIQGPTFPNACVFFKCIANCKQNGYGGGYCTMNGCQCLR